LQIYQLTAERKRLEHQVREWETRLTEANTNLEKIEARIRELQSDANLEPKTPRTRPKRVPLGPGGTVVIEY
jgi:septal ring factor EnvC (AmiA/AmiB activator)